VVVQQLSEFPASCGIRSFVAVLETPVLDPLLRQLWKLS